MPVYEFEINGKTYEVEAPQMPSAAQMRSVAARMGGGPRKPASPDDFTDRRPAPQGSAVGRAASGAWEMLNPVTMVQGLYGAVRHPIDTGKALVGAQFDQLGKARQAFGEGRYSEAAGHAGAGILPILGPAAANVGEQIAETGDIATGIGRGLGLAAPIPLAKPAIAAVKKIPPKALTRPQKAAAAAANAKQADAVRWALEQGIPVDAGTASGNRVVRGAKAIADSSLGGAVTGQRAGAARAESMASVGRDLARRADMTPDGIPSAGVTPETAGSAVRAGVERVIKDQAGLADDAYAKVRNAERNALPDDVPVSRKVGSGRTVDQGFIGHWLADDLNEMGYQAGGGSKKFYDLAEAEWRAGDSDAARHGIGVGSGRVAGTPTQEMFHAAGVSGSRAEIATKIRRYLSGQSDNPRIAGIVDAMGEAWDGQRFDWDLLTDETLARTGLKRNQFKSPITMPAMEAPGAAKFFGDEAPGLNASGTEPMQLAVPLASAKDALRPVFERLQRKKELTGQLMGDEGRAATALDALISGPDNAPLSVVDAALGDLKAAARGAALPELRTSGQGLAAQAVTELEALVQARAKAAGVWDDLRAGRDATIAKWTAAETLDKLRAEPVQTFRMLTSAGDAAVERLREVKKLAPGDVPKIGRAFLDDLLDTATAEGGFGREAKLWADWERLGPETKALLYPDPALRSSLDKFFLVGKKMAENPNPSGSALVGGLTAQGTLALMDPVTGAATTITGYALSKLLNSPKTAKLLVDGLQMPRTAAAARSLSARLSAAIDKASPVAPGVAAGAEGARSRPEMSKRFAQAVQAIDKMAAEGRPDTLPAWKKRAQFAFETGIDTLAGVLGLPGGPETKARMVAELVAAGVPFVGSTKALTAGVKAAKATETAGAAAKAGKIRAYHGSPHDFDRFSMEKIGSGEGAQAYGHGLYFAERKGTAETYRSGLSNTEVLVGGVRREVPSWHAGMAAEDRLIRRIADRRLTAPEASDSEIVQQVRDSIDAELKTGLKWASDDAIAAVKQQREMLDRFEKQGISTRHGRMYEVEIDASPDDLLDWDAPLADQPGVASKLGFGNRPTDDEIDALMARLRAEVGPEKLAQHPDFKAMEARLDAAYSAKERGEDWYRSSSKAGSDAGRESFRTGGPSSGSEAASRYLLSRGVKGIKYLDQQSRGVTGGEIIDVSQDAEGAWRAKVRVPARGDSGTMFTTSKPYATAAEARRWAEEAAAQGTRNFVIFDDSLISILKKYGVMGAVTSGVLAEYLQRRSAASRTSS